MSLSKHALTYLKRHYRALYQRAYALELATSLMRWVNLIPAATTSPKPAPTRARRSRALPLLIVLTTLTCGSGLEAAHAADISGTHTGSDDVYIDKAGTYTVADGTTFKNVSHPTSCPISMYHPLGHFELIFEGSALFESNSASTIGYGGGAIEVYDSLNFNGGTGDIIFSGNNANTSQFNAEGGAIYTIDALTMTGSTGKISFSGNQAKNGGAISSSSINLTAGSGGIEFINNRASVHGGAIYVYYNYYNDNNINLTAAEGDIVFSGNTAGSTRNAIYIYSSDPPTINLQAKGNHFISFEDAISGRDPKYIDVLLNDGTDYDGTIKFSTSMTLGQIAQFDGTFELSGTNTTLSSNYTLANGTYEVKKGATGDHRNFQQNNGELKVEGVLEATTFNYNNGIFDIDGKLDVNTFNQLDGDLKAGSGNDDNLTLNGTMKVENYQLKTGSLTVGDSADGLAITALTLSTDTTLTVENGFGGSIESLVNNGGTLQGDGLSGLTLKEFSTTVDYTFTKETSPQVTTFKLLTGGSYTVSTGEHAQYDTFEMDGNSLTVESQGSFTADSFTHSTGSISLQPGSTFTVAKGNYTSPKYTTATTVLELSSGSDFVVLGSYTLSEGGQVKVSGLGSTITAQSIAFESGSELYFTIDESVKGNEPENAMLILNQTVNTQAISLAGVTVTVPSEAATAAKQRAARTGTAEAVHLLYSKTGLTDLPADGTNNLYRFQVKDTGGESYSYGQDTTTDPGIDPDPGTDPDPGQGGTDPGQGGTDPSTGDGGQTDPQPGTGEGGSNPGTGEGGSQGGGSLIAVRDPQALEHMGATGNQAHAFSIFENGTFAEGSPEARFFKAKGGIFEVTQQDGAAGLTALTALLPNDAPVVLDQARNTMSFITQAAFDGAGLPPGRSGRAQVSLSAQNQGASPIAGANSVASLSTASTGRSAVQDEGGRISAPLSLNSALWLKARLNSIDSERYENGSAGYDGDLSLLALGIDTALTSEWSLGLGFSYSKGDLDGLSRSVESEGYTLFGYSRYHSGNWYLNGLVAVSLEDYEEDSQVLSHSLTSDYRATTLYGGIFTGLELSTAQGGTFSPEIGLTVFSTKLSDYDSELSDNIEAERATISSALAGFKWQLTALSTESAELNVKGALHARYDLSTEGIDYDVGLSNGTHLQLAGEEPDRFALMPSLGVSLKLGPSRAFELEARYSAELSEHFTGQAVSLGLNYRF